MNFCSKCGHQLNSMNEVCPNCGFQNTAEPNYNQNANPVQNNYNYGGQNQRVEANTTGILIWSIVNLVCFCLPLGVAGLIFALQAKSAQTQADADKAIKTAKTLNLVGTIGGIIVVILYFVLVVAAAGASSISNYY